MWSSVAVDGDARRGVFHTAHGDFETPAFMPVGTQATVKGVSPIQLRELGAQIILSNTYHLHIRPGDALIKEFGGLHKFMNWSGPILTDSGGFQVFSLAKIRKVTADGVRFQSHIDGRQIFLTPENVIGIQENLGVDIMMVLDECVPYPAEREVVRTSLELTLSWAARAKKARTKDQIAMFGIVQGGMFPELRREAAEKLVEIGFDGYAIGGLSVGEANQLMYDITESTTPKLPTEKVRYLMGVGTPEDILESVSRGIDMFDCVIPTRSARFGRIYTKNGLVNIRNSEHRRSNEPLDSSCNCYTCTNFSRGYLSHLVHAREVLSVTLNTIHNLYFYQWLMREIREAISDGLFFARKRELLSRLGQGQ